MAVGYKTGGRRKGTPNKRTRMAADAIALVFDAIGGVDAFAAWAAQEPGEFYRLYAKLLPLQVKADISGGLAVRVASDVARVA